jgi:hypothetical protein
MSQIKIKFLKDFYNPITSKLIPADSAIEIEADSEDTPLESFWQEQLKFNDISKIIEIITTDKPKKK